MSRLAGAVVLVLAALLTACGNSEAPPADPSTSSRVPEDNVFSGQVRALEKAEQVQNTINDAAARQHDRIDQQAQ